MLSIEYFEHFKQLVNTNMDEADFSGPKPDSLIAKAEAALKLIFPPSYKIFLKNYGCGSFMGDEFYGIINANFEKSTVPDAIGLTLEYRKKGLPTSLILIYSFGTGEYAALDLSRTNYEGESPVIACHPGFDINLSRAEILADSYGEFLYNTVKAN